MPLGLDGMLSDEVDAIRARLAAIVESSQDAILAKDLSGIITAWNPAAERLYGYSAQEIVGQSVDMIIPRDLAGESEYILGEVLAGRAVPPHDTERVTKDGTRIPVSVAVSPVCDAAGNVIGASTIARDITDRLAAETERAWTEMLVRQSADAIVALDSEGRISTWNPAAEKLFGYSEDEALGQWPQDVVASDDPSEQVEVSESVLRAGHTRRYEARRKHRDGRELIVEISIAPLNGPEGGPRGAVVSVRDVTEARAAQVRIQQAAERESQLKHELEQTRRLESVGQLAGGIAHDFNNLLAVILNLAAFVAAELPEGSPARADAEEIELAAKRAASLTRQLLIFSRRDVVAAELFDPAVLVGGLEGLLQRALGENMLLEVLSDERPWMVEMDRGQLEQIVVNLAINARDAMPNGGRLIIEIRNTVVDDEFASTRVRLNPGRYVSLRVSDTGTGMDAEVLERAFEPYFSTKPKGHGNGLGLATVYGIVSSAGGRVVLYSEPGRGTTVNVHLPARGPVIGPAAPDAVPAKLGAGEQILVVEDAPDVRDIAERILVAGGYQVATAGSATEALAVIDSEWSVDLVLTDVVMPVMTGPELVEILHARDPSAKVIFMSGYSYQLLNEDILDHPATAFLEKPFTAEQLRTKVRDLLDAQVGSA